MNIDLGNYTITSDAQNFILNEKVVIQKGKRVGETQLVTVGYYGSWEGLSNRMLQVELSKSDATQLSEIADLVCDFNNNVTTLLKGLPKEVAAK